MKSDYKREIKMKHKNGTFALRKNAHARKITIAAVKIELNEGKDFLSDTFGEMT
jgi:hypothetical protein